MIFAFLTLKKTVEEHREAIEEIIAKARRGMIPVSGFISPGENEALKRLKAEPLARFVKTLPNALPPKYDPSVEDSRELAAHRLVILSGMAETGNKKEDRQISLTACLYAANL